MSKYTAMVVAASRVLNQRTADESGVDAEDQWKYYSESFKEDAQAMLDAIGAPELLEALESAIAPLELYKAYGWSDRNNVIGKAKASIAKAKGEQA